jgi:hypothetical protein
MEKIKLTNNAKRILLILNKNEEPVISDADERDLYLLEQEELIVLEGCKNGYPFPEITRKGLSYVQMNPKLSNPSIWDDKKYWITSGISLAALALSIYASFIK